MKINKNYLNLEESYLFSTVAQKVKDFKSKNVDADIISLGIGDVTKPLCKAVVSALHDASNEMSDESTFKGYGPEQGYSFLRSKIREHYKKHGVSVEENEIFISDGAKSDLGNILDIFSKDNVVLIPDPVYPVYVDTNIMDGRKILFIDANEENGFLPLPDNNIKADLIYICSPNNPTGAVYNKEQLKLWVDYANKNESVILFDSAYEYFISEEGYPHSIFEIDGAKSCAIEFCSFSKTAGFTGTRCGYTVIPMELKRENVNINKLWLRRQTTKFNGVSYVVQKAAEAIFTDEGQKQIYETINYYKENAKILASALKEKNIWFVGGVNSPYVWMKCPNNMKSWEFFDYLLSNANIVGTPGCGFGKNGEGFFRLTAFGKRESMLKAAERIKKLNLK